MGDLIKFPTKEAELTDIEIGDKIVQAMRLKALEYLKENGVGLKNEEQLEMYYAHFCGSMKGWLGNLLQYTPEDVKKKIKDEYA